MIFIATISSSLALQLTLGYLAVFLYFAITVRNNYDFVFFLYRLDTEKALKQVTSATRVFPEDAGK